MGRVLRSRDALVKRNCENFSPKTVVEKPKVKITGSSSKRGKSVLSDRTNINLNSDTKGKCTKVVKCDTNEKKIIESKRKTTKVPTASSESGSVIRKSKRISNVSNSSKLSTSYECSKKGIVESKKVNVKTKTRYVQISKNSKDQHLDFDEECNKTIDKSNTHEPFMGFENANKSPLHDLLNKTVDVSIKKDPCKKSYLPVYRLNKPSPPKMCSNSAKDRLHMYDFEVDENEPVAKKSKRKPILKIKKCRTYNKKKKAISAPTLVNNSNQENVCPNTKCVSSASVNNSNQENLCSNAKCVPSTSVNNSRNVGLNRRLSAGPQTGYTPLSPIPESCTQDCLDESIGNEIDNSFGSCASNRQNIAYSPPPYESPKRDSLNVPIVRTSVSRHNDTVCSKSLNKSVNSCRHDISINSPFSANFNSPMYIGSSTPIHRHWAEQSNHVYSNITERAIEAFDITNNFGFSDVDVVEEPIVSPIKKYVTPVKAVTPRKPSPVKIPHQKVVRMLKFGPDASDDVTPEDDSLPIDELLPLNFFRDGDTPAFSPTSSPRTPVVLKKGRKVNLNKTVKKKRVVIVEEPDDSDFATQSSEDKTSQEDERTFKIGQASQRITRSKQGLSKTLKPNQTSNKNDSDTENDKGYETEISPNKQNISINVTKEGRRSYERPAYLRPNKKYGRLQSEDTDYEEEEEQEEVVAKEKPQPKKKNARTKKEELELEKWAKAFNEQCLQVENFNLVVE